MFKVFKAPVPAARARVKSKYPFATMSEGDAFTVPAKAPESTRNSSGGCAAASAAHSWGRRHGGRFVTRRNLDDSLTVYRTGD